MRKVALITIALLVITSPAYGLGIAVDTLVLDITTQAPVPLIDQPLPIVETPLPSVEVETPIANIKPDATTADTPIAVNVKPTIANPDIQGPTVDAPSDNVTNQGQTTVKPQGSSPTNSSAQQSDKPAGAVGSGPSAAPDSSAPTAEIQTPRLGAPVAAPRPAATGAESSAPTRSKQQTFTQAALSAATAPVERVAQILSDNPWILAWAVLIMSLSGGWVLYLKRSSAPAPSRELLARR